MKKIGFEGDEFEQSTLALYWLPIFDRGWIVFKCFNEKCDYMKFIYVSDEEE